MLVSKKMEMAGTILTLVSICIALRLFFFTGFYVTSDDANYSKAAYEITQFRATLPQNHHEGRIGHIFSIACLYFLFGINEYSVSFTSIVYSILNMILIYLLCRELFDEYDWARIAGLASFFFIFVPISIERGSSLDFAQGLTFYMFLSIYFVFLSGRKKKDLFCLLSGLTIGLAYLFHETGTYIFLAIIPYWILRKKSLKSICYVFLGFLLVFLAENCIYYAQTGKILYRQTIALKTHFKISEVKNIDDLMGAKKELKPIANPFSGTFLGDSWVLEPFRQILLNPATSIIYHMFFFATIYLILKRDKKIIILSILFWPLFLYFSYGSPNPLSYVPLRRLPRYILPCMIPVCMATSYGLTKLISRQALRNLIVLSYIVLSLFCISIKGGEMGQRFHQCKFFYNFMEKNPDEHFITDSGTLFGLEFLNRYKLFQNLKIISFREFMSEIKESEFLRQSEGSYLFVNLPELYGYNTIDINNENYGLIDQNDRKPRKICYVPFLKNSMKHSLCDFSNGGKIYKIRKLNEEHDDY